MGTNVPGGRKQRLEWIEGLIGQWIDNQAIIGLTSAQLTTLDADITAARDAFTSVEQIRLNSKSETQDYYTKADDVHTTASEYLTVIKGTAETSDNPSSVYLAAGITPADQPSPVPAPTQPAIENATLGGDGSVTLNFSATGPTGTVWQVSRQLAAETSFTFIGNASPHTKSFLDDNVPVGTSTATYQIRGVRGALVGPASFDFTVKLGVPAGESGAMGEAA